MTKKERPPSLARINRENEEAYSGVAGEYAARDRGEKGFSMKNDPGFVEAFLERVNEAFPGVPNEKLAILDIGVGAGINLRMFADRGFETHGSEIVEDMILAAKTQSPGTHFQKGDFLREFRAPRKFNGIMAKAFIHLFPDEIAREMLGKMRDILEEGGIIFLATTVHDTTSWGKEQKEGFQGKARRWRKKWARDDFEKFLGSVKGLEIIPTPEEISENRDALGRPWMNFMLRKASGKQVR